MDLILEQRVVCVAVLDDAEDAVPLAEALLAGGMNVLEITLRTRAAADSISRIRRRLPEVYVGAGTVLNPHQAAQAADAGAQFLVSPGLDQRVLTEASARGLPCIPGVMTPTDVVQALNLSCKLLKFFPAEAAGGVAMLKALCGPFGHTGAQFIPTGGINALKAPAYLALPEVAAVGGSWMAERELVAQRAWDKITALAADAIRIGLRRA